VPWWPTTRWDRGEKARFRVRETLDWQRHAGELESEMLRRRMFFDVIDWSEEQASLPFDEAGTQN
jgi:hypothetical protein